MSTPQHKPKQQEATIRDFVNVVFRRKFIILSIVAVTTFAVVFLKAAQPQTFVSSSRTLVKRGETANLYSHRPTILSWEEDVSSQIEIILSQTVFSKASEIFVDSTAAYGVEHLAFNPAAVRADVVGESNVFIISYIAFDPLEARLGCVATTDAYKEYYHERSAPPAMSDYFVSEISASLHELEHWRGKKSEFLSTERYRGIDEENNVHTFKLARLEADLADVDNDLPVYAMRAERLEGLLALPPDDLENNLAVGGARNDMQSAIMRNLKQDLQRQRSRREELLQRYTDKHPDVVTVDEQIEELQAQIRHEVENAYDVARASYDELIAKRTILRQQVAATHASLNELPEKEASLSRIENKIASAQARYDLLIKRQSEAEIAVASTPAWDVTVIASPSAGYPQKTKDYVRMALGPFLALIVGLGVAFFFESMDHSLKNPGEVEEYLHMPVLATFGDVSKGK